MEGAHYGEPAYFGEKEKRTSTEGNIGVDVETKAR